MDQETKLSWIVHSRKAQLLGLCISLTALIWCVFGQTLKHDFVTYDDGKYVYENAQVKGGLTTQGIIWAFTHSHSNNWHPLTWISHMIDCETYGLRPGGHHFSGVVLHNLAAVLLFLVLQQMTGAMWRSAFVAAVFAIHPLRVESVAWVAERKDVLSGVFFMLTVGAYARYVRKPSLVRYIAVSILFAAGLMSKPMLVTTPFVLLLLDYWPLNRFHSLPLRRLILEKIPLLTLSLAASVVTLLVQEPIVHSTTALPFQWRLANAAVSCVTYMRQMIWPAGLAVFYPYPAKGLPLWDVALSLMVLFLFTVVAFLLRRRRAYLVTGWLWYLVMLIPVCGIVQVGAQAHADRYTYLPQIGLYLLATWLIGDLFATSRLCLRLLTPAVLIIIGALVYCASTQAAYWRDGETLWKRALAVIPNNSIAHNNLSLTLGQQGRTDDAISHLKKAISIWPDYEEAHYNLANILLQTGRVDDAIEQYERALVLQPDYAGAMVNLGNAFLQKGAITEAIPYYQKALKLQPETAIVHYNLAVAYVRTGKLDEAIPEYEKALAIEPKDVDAHCNLGSALFLRGQIRKAIVHWEEAVKIQPNNARALAYLAFVYATAGDDSIRDGSKAVNLAEHAVQLSSRSDARSFRALAAALAETGRFSEAIKVAQDARQLAEQVNDHNLVSSLATEIDLYRNNIPLRDLQTKE